MNIGLSEIVIVIINLALIVGIPVVIIWVGIHLSRRINALESRLEKLESNKDTNSGKHRE